MEKMAHFFSLKTSREVWLKKENILLILIIALGFILRIYKIKDYIVFLGDEGRDALVVYAILHGDPTLLGPTSSVGGFFLGPIYYYMMAPFLLLSNFDPVGPAVMVVLVGLLTIYLVYQVGKVFFGIRAGLIASLLYAVSPIVIIYSRSSWNPNVFPFFTISSLYVLYKAIKLNKWWMFVLSGFLMGINLQIHYLATFVGAIMFLYVLFADIKLNLGWFKKTLKQYLLMFVGFVIGFSPFLAFEVRHQFANSYSIINFVINSPETGAEGQLFTNSYTAFLRLFGGVTLGLPESAKFGNFDPLLIKVWIIGSILFGLIVVGYFFFQFYKKYRDKGIYLKYLLILIWGLVGIGLFIFYNRDVFDYYLGFLYPLPFLLIGLFLSDLSYKFKKFGIILAGFAVFALVAISLYFTPIRVPGNHMVDQTKETSDFILSKTNGDEFNFALMTAGNSDHAYRYFFKLANRDPVVIQNSDIDPDRNSVTDQLLVICDKSIPCGPLGYSLWEVAGFGRAQIEDEWEFANITVYKLIPYEGEN